VSGAGSIFLALCPLVNWSLLAAPQATPPKLAVVRATLHHQQEDAPPIPTSYEYLPGELLYFSFRIAGYHVQKDHVDLRYQVVLTDPDGILVIPPMTGGVAAEVSSNDKDWLPRVQETIPLPPLLPSGAFHLRFRVSDEFGKVSAEETVEFHVRGQAIAPSDILVVRNIRFYRGEQDRDSIDPPVYRAGDPVWGRFEIAGYKLGPKNKFDVEYGLAVYRPSGKPLYQEPNAAAEQDEPFYPKKLLFGVLNLNLSPDLSPGEYTLVVLGRDKLGAQTCEAKTTFKVETR
jgi:hypothetical protein